MSTELTYTPSLFERIVGSDLIVRARFGNPREVRPAEGFDSPAVSACSRWRLLTSCTGGRRHR
jgi:hypothetical protein